MDQATCTTTFAFYLLQLEGVSGNGVQRTYITQENTDYYNVLWLSID